MPRFDRTAGTSRRAVRPALILLALFILGACAETQLLVNTAKRILPEKQDAPVGIYKIGNPYQIEGVWYYPVVNYDYVETGIASWYGAKFHGRPTANGEIYNMNALTAAHRTLPLPSVVRVTNLENGRSIKVKVNDRGPFAHGRIIDLSRRGAQLLGFEVQGTARVRVQIVGDESRRIARNLTGTGPAGVPDTPIRNADRVKKSVVTTEALAPPPGAKAARRSEPEKPKNIQLVSREPVFVAPRKLDGRVTFEAVSPTGIYIQAGAFSVYQNAFQVAARLFGIEKVKVTSAIVGGKEFFRVRIGPLPSVEAADAVLDGVIRAGYPNSRIIVD